MSYAIHHQLPIKAPLHEVYGAVTDANRLENWWPKECSGQPVEGSQYRFYFGPEYDWQGKVEKAVRDQSFHIKMTRADEDWNPTSFGFDLEPAEGEVLLNFWHIGWPECNTHFRRSSYCWAILLSGLKDYVEKGVVIPFEERE